jgi:hypothetical protein
VDDAANVVGLVDDVVGPVDAAADVGAVGTIVAAEKLPKTKIV